MQKGVFCGGIGTHVDDGFCGGDYLFQGKLNQQGVIFPFGAFYRRAFTFTGIHMRQLEDLSIVRNQGEYIEAFDSINVPRERRKDESL